VADDDLTSESAPSAGDEAPFAAVVRAHWTAVFRLLGVMTGNVHDTEELTQETFLRALRSFSSFRPETNLRAWLLRIAANAWSDVRRKRQRIPFRSLNDDPPDGSAAPETRLELAEHSRLLQTAMEQLSETARAVFHLRVVEDLSFREIADMLDTTEQAARWQMHDARQKLLRQMAGKI
jgi:RNA polymerase sigma factor (sigma-70 family)